MMRPNTGAAHRSHRRSNRIRGSFESRAKTLPRKRVVMSPMSGRSKNRGRTPSGRADRGSSRWEDNSSWSCVWDERSGDKDEARKHKPNNGKVKGGKLKAGRSKSNGEGQEGKRDGGSIGSTWSSGRWSKEKT